MVGTECYRDYFGWNRVLSRGYFDWNRMFIDRLLSLQQSVIEIFLFKHSAAKILLFGDKVLPRGYLLETWWYLSSHIKLFPETGVATIMDYLVLMFINFKSTKHLWDKQNVYKLRDILNVCKNRFNIQQ